MKNSSFLAKFDFFDITAGISLWLKKVVFLI